MHRVCFLTILSCLVVSTALAPDPLKADPTHFKLEFENASVRVLRAHCGPHEKIAMHGHPDHVIVYLTDSKTRQT